MPVRHEPLPTPRSAAPSPLAAAGSSARLDTARGRLAGQLATAALLLLTIVLGGAATSLSHSGPAPRGLPGGVSEDRILAQGRVEAVPLGARWAGVMTASLAPGAAWPQEQTGYEDVGALLFLVESGALTVQAEGPIVVADSAGRGKTAPADMDTVLRTGESGFTPGGMRSTWRNDGAEPVRVLFVKLAVVGYDTHTRLPAGVTRTPLIEQRAAREPTGPVRVTLRRVTLPARAALPFDAVPGLTLLSIVSGELHVLDPPRAGDAANPLLPTQAGTGRRISRGSAATGTFRPGRVASNPGAADTTLLLLTIAPEGEAAGPAATSP